MKMRINVTKDVIEQSRYCGYTSILVSENCAITNAVRELFPEAVTGSSCIHFKDEHDSISNLPPEGRMFVVHFDRRSAKERMRMEPISFEIDVPDEVIAEIGQENVDYVLSQSLTLEAV